MNENYDIKLENLTQKVNKITNDKTYFSPNLFYRKINNVYIYSFIIPIFLTFLLAIIKPGFLMYKKDDKYLINFTKLFIIFFILIILTIILNYAYFKKKV